MKITKKWKRIMLAFAGLLCVLLVGQKSMTVKAAEDLSVKVCNTEVTEGGYWKTDGTDKISPGSESDYNIYYDKASRTLYLKDAVMEEQENRGDDIIRIKGRGAGKNVTISIAGKNSVTNKANLGDAIASDVEIILTGEGSLNSRGHYFGIDSASITVHSGEWLFEGPNGGLRSTKLAMTGGSVKCISNDTGIRVYNDLIITGGTLIGEGRTGLFFLYLYNGITVLGENTVVELTSTTGFAAYYNSGVLEGKNLREPYAALVKPENGTYRKFDGSEGYSFFDKNGDAALKVTLKGAREVRLGTKTDVSPIFKQGVTKASDKIDITTVAGGVGKTFKKEDFSISSSSTKETAISGVTVTALSDSEPTTNGKLTIELTDKVGFQSAYLWFEKRCVGKILLNPINYYHVKLNMKLDDKAWSGLKNQLSLRLEPSGAPTYTMTEETSGTYYADVPNGIYHLYNGEKDTGKKIIVADHKTETAEFYTLDTTVLYGDGTDALEVNGQKLRDMNNSLEILKGLSVNVKAAPNTERKVTEYTDSKQPGANKEVVTAGYSFAMEGQRTLSAKFASIHKPAPTKENLSFKLDEATFNEDRHEIAVTPKFGIIGIGAITVKYNGNVMPPTDAGDYTITADIAEGDVYAEIDGLELGTFRINKKVLNAADLEAGIPIISYSTNPDDKTVSDIEIPVFLKTGFLLSIPADCATLKLPSRGTAMSSGATQATYQDAELTIKTIDSTNYSFTGTLSNQKYTVIQGDLKSITIKNSPDKKDYVEGEYFDVKGMKVSAIYHVDDPSGGAGKDEEIEVDINQCIMYPTAALSTSDTVITIGYGMGDEYLTVGQPITVNALQATDIKITTPPNQTEYIEGTIFNPTGLAVEATYNNGEKLDVTGICNFDKDPVVLSQDKTIVSLSENTLSPVTAEQSITVKAKKVLEVITGKFPAKLSYSVGEKFNPTGLAMLLVYDNGALEVDEYNDSTKSQFTFVPGLSTALKESDKEVKVTFEGKENKIGIQVEKKTYSVAVKADPEEGGAVTGGGIVEEDASTVLGAAAHDGYQFVNWTEDGKEVSKESSFTVKNIKANHEYTAVFKKEVKKQYTITVKADPAEGGTVAGGGSIEEGSNAYLRADAAGGYQFVNWTEGGKEVSTEAEFIVEDVRADHEYTAVFKKSTKKQYTITVKADPAEGGTVSGGGTVEEGSSTTVKAEAKSGYQFMNWTEDGKEVSTEASYTVKDIKADHQYTAVFKQIVGKQYTITLKANPAEGGTVSGGGAVAEGSSTTIKAEAKSGYQFVNWTEGGKEVSKEASFTIKDIKADHEYTAVFKKAAASPDSSKTVKTGDKTSIVVYAVILILMAAVIAIAGVFVWKRKK